MVQINFALREVNCKIVYYGPGLSGKTTNLEKIHEKASKKSVGELTSIATEGDRTLFFDFLPLDLGNVAGMKTKFQLYTVPGQVYYNATRKLVLQGCDGVVFVADSQTDKMSENIESLKNLAENLAENGLDLNDVPLVIQFNKRDLPNIMPVEEMSRQLNKYQAPVYEAVATTGQGIFPTLKAIAKQVLDSLNEAQGDAAPAPPVPAQRQAPPPAPVPVAQQEAKMKLQSAQDYTTPTSPAPPPQQAPAPPPAPPPPQQQAQVPVPQTAVPPPQQATPAEGVDAAASSGPRIRKKRRGKGSGTATMIMIIGCFLFLCFVIFVVLAKGSLDWCAKLCEMAGI